MENYRINRRRGSSWDVWRDFDEAPIPIRVSTPHEKRWKTQNACMGLVRNEVEIVPVTTVVADNDITFEQTDHTAQTFEANH